MQTLSPIATTDALYDCACQLFNALWNGSPIRLLGVRTSRLQSKQDPIQLSLFDLNFSLAEASSVRCPVFLWPPRKKAGSGQAAKARCGDGSDPSAVRKRRHYARLTPCTACVPHRSARLMSIRMPVPRQHMTGRHGFTFLHESPFSA